MKINYKTKPLELQVGDRVKLDKNNPLIEKYSHWTLKNVTDCEFEIVRLKKQYRGETAVETKLITKGTQNGLTWNLPKELLIKCI